MPNPAQHITRGIFIYQRGAFKEHMFEAEIKRGMSCNIKDMNAWHCLYTQVSNISNQKGFSLPSATHECVEHLLTGCDGRNIFHMDAQREDNSPYLVADAETYEGQYVTAEDFFSNKVVTHSTSLSEAYN